MGKRSADKHYARRLQRGRSVSSVVATIILIAIVVVGGLAAYHAMNSAAGIAQQRVQVLPETMDLRVSADGAAIFTATVKNTGNKPIILLKIKVHNEDEYAVPSVTSLAPLQPGRTVAVTITSLHAERYVPGNRYAVVISATASDGSTFTHTTAVTCMGAAQGGVPGEAERFGFTFEASDEVTRISPYEYSMPLVLRRVSGDPEDVRLSAINLPEGFTVSFDPEEVLLEDEVEVTATIVVSGDVEEGEYQLNLRATSESGVVKSEELNVLVTEYLLLGLPDADEWTISCRISETSDGGFLVAGWRGDDEVPILYRLRPDGEILWERDFKDLAFRMALVFEISGGDVIYVGDTWDEGLWIARLKSINGEEVWSVMFDPLEAEYQYPIHESESYSFSDAEIVGDGVVIVGSLSFFDVDGAQRSGGWVAYFDLNGELQWTTAILCEENGDVYNTFVLTMIGASDTEVIVGGSTQYLSSEAYAACITTSNGEKMWEARYSFGPDHDATFYSISKCGDDFIGAGGVENGEAYTLFIIFEYGGDLVKDIVIDMMPGAGFEGAENVAELTNGDVVFLTFTGEVGRLDVDGEDVEWLQPVEGNVIWRWSLTVTFDGTVVSSGSWLEGGNCDIVLEKFSADGERLKWITFDLP